MLPIYKSYILENWLPVTACSLLFLVVLKWMAKRPTTPMLNTVQNADQEYPESVQEYPEQDPDLSPALNIEKYVNYPGARKYFAGGIDPFFAMMDDRRSIRHFSDRPVDLQQVERAIHCAGTSPSGAHSEPWTFCLVTSGETKLQIREIVENEEYINYKQRMHRQWTADLRPFKTSHVKEYLTTAPCLILIFKQTHGYRADGKKKEHYYNEISVSIATGILLCALQAAGMSSLVTTPLNCGPALRSVLARPPNEKLLVLLPVGYPAAECPVPDLRRKGLDEIMVKY